MDGSRAFGEAGVKTTGDGILTEFASGPPAASLLSGPQRGGPDADGGQALRRLPTHSCPSTARDWELRSPIGTGANERQVLY